MLTRRKDGRFVKKITLADGTEKYFYSSAKSERDAVREIERKMVAFQQDTRNKNTFRSVADEWDTDYRTRISKINYRKNTRAAYQRIVEYFGDAIIPEITIADISRFINQLARQGFYKKNCINAQKHT